MYHFQWQRKFSCKWLVALFCTVILVCLKPIYLFLHIFKIRAEHLYENGHSSSLDHHTGLMGCTWSNVGQHPCSLKLKQERKIYLNWLVIFFPPAKHIQQILHLAYIASDRKAGKKWTSGLSCLVRSFGLALIYCVDTMWRPTCRVQFSLLFRNSTKRSTTPAVAMTSSMGGLGSEVESMTKINSYNSNKNCCNLPVSTQNYTKTIQ